MELTTFKEYNFIIILSNYRFHYNTFQLYSYNKLVAIVMNAGFH